MNTQPFVASSPTGPQPSGSAGHWSRLLTLRELASAALVAGLWFGLSPLAHAASMMPLDLSQLTQRAELILVGEVGPQQSRKTDGGLIVTDVEISPRQIIKGDAQLHTPLLVTHLGGVVGEVGLHVPGEATFNAGEQVLLFLRRDPTDDLRVVGMSQGKLAVETAGGTQWVQTSPHQDHVLPPKAGSALRQPQNDAPKASAEDAVEDVDHRRPLSEFIRDLEHLLSP